MKLGAEGEVPLLENCGVKQEEKGLLSRTSDELKKQWKIVGPEEVGWLSFYGMWTITISYAGRLGNLEHASISIALNVFLLLNFGLLLGMASGMETLCGQAYGANKYHMLGVYLERSWIVLFLCAILALPVYFYASPLLILFGQPLEMWYYRILILLTGNLRNATIAVDALSICMSINGWVEMVPTSFLAGTGTTWVEV